MDNNVSRRKFLGGLVAVPTMAALAAPLAAVGAYIYPPDSFLQPPAPKKVGNINDLKAWDYIPFGYNQAPAMVIKTDTGDIQSFYLKCTHLGCTVEVPEGNLDGKQLVCPCHGGYFDPLGNNTGGPPPTPLKQLAVTIEENGDIIVEERMA
ncbi:Rieske (2Fe-2S) protein [Heliorestis acidaminivorans]|uniref:Rieske (2Fe-2S) protein n=1 Tax=Heliorestis acidaminivorans TaxID=553427 RepID=A0A6I0F145_9FIRM|nr:Rieske (2Fe-2S) protein [Heliorestis acidaminivorans]KAB2953054.1 Rieske (2Fe-2S) protein [Heliorestis acidaminivorans]